ncbi:MAG: hypothetical protein KKD38_03965 [Candidatus Delongbacteria bacterium]|nr:hypothetical protein [Candidatus Delongbacteria bacterium]MCG2760806.1 hypothetical protein [Candidatus Delongbacteria bacterium]
MVQRITKMLLVLTLLAGTGLKAETLFEIKDEFGRPVMVVTSEGLTILNANDTIMVINSSRINAFIQQDATKGLSRSFSVSSTSSNKGQTKVFDVANDGLRVSNEYGKIMDVTGSNITAYIDDSQKDKGLSRSFSVSSTSSNKGQTKVFDVANDGLRVSNEYGKIMDVTGSNITAYVDDSQKDKGLSRSFSVTTTASTKGVNTNLLNVNTDGMMVSNSTEKLMDITGSNITAYIDGDAHSNSHGTKALSRSFSVTSTSSGKDKDESILDVASDGLRVLNENKQLVKELEILRAEIELIKKQLDGIVK